MPSGLTELADALAAFTKARHHEKDRISPENLTRLDSLSARLADSLHSLKKKTPLWKRLCAISAPLTQEEKGLLEEVRSFYSRTFPEKKYATLAENVDVVLVALIVAIGIRSYFLQPFKIPTNSMFPSLRGVVLTPLPPETPMPSAPAALWERITCGRTHHTLDLPAGAIFLGEKRSGFFLFQTLDLHFRHGDDHLTKSFRTEADSAAILQAAGIPRYLGSPAPEAIHLRFQVDTGDHLFVNKMAYHFSKPTSGEPFVFRTMGLMTSRNLLQRDTSEGSQYYIKRCVFDGPGTVQVQPPKLFLNGAEATHPSIRRVWESALPGYKGYSHGSEDGSVMNYLRSPEDSYELPPFTYWAMGDNSYNSADSRQFGPVPLPNLVGRASFIYYPLNRIVHAID